MSKRFAVLIMRSHARIVCLFCSLLNLASTAPSSLCPAPISQWTESTTSPTTTLADSWFCFLMGTTDKSQCTALRGFVADIRDSFDSQYIVGYLNGIYNNSKGKINPFPVMVGLVKNGTQTYWNDNCLNPTATTSTMKITQSQNQNDFYVLKSDGSLVPGSSTPSTGILCRYDTKPCSRPEYSQQCSKGPACLANDSCFTCGTVTTARTTISSAISPTTTANTTSTPQSTFTTKPTTTTTPALVTPPIQCPGLIKQWTESKTSTTTTLADSWFCFLPGATDKTQCTALRGFVSDIRDPYDSQYIVGYLTEIYNNSNGQLNPFPALIGLVKNGNSNTWNDGCLNPSLSSSSKTTISTQTNDGYVLNIDGSITPSSSAQPAGILCRYDTKPCSRPEYYQTCSNGLTCMANDSCFFCGNPTTTPTVTTITITAATTTKLLVTAQNGLVQTTLPMYDNPFELTTTVPDITQYDEMTWDRVYHGIFYILFFMAVGDVVIITLIYTLRIYKDIKNPDYSYEFLR